MQYHQHRWIILLIAASAFGAQPASGQAWIGQVVGNVLAQQAAAAAEHACMSGTAMPDSEVAETRPTSLASVRSYWDAVKNGGPVAVSQLFVSSKKSLWSNGSTSKAIVPGAMVTDPFVLPGTQLADEPLRFVRAGDGRSVGSQWEVRNSDGLLIGTYDIQLRRVGSVWKLQELRLIPASEYVEPLTQYCHTVGDVLPYRLKSTKNAMTYTAKRAAKMAAKAQKAEADAAKTLRTTVNASGSASGTEKLRLSQSADRAAVARRKAEEAGRAADHAKIEYAKALADAAALEEARKQGLANLASKI